MNSHTQELNTYFGKIDEEVKKAYVVAESARKKGLDPEEKVDIPVAKGIGERVEGLISAVVPKIMNSGVAVRISKLEKQYGTLDWRVALKIAEEVATEKFFKLPSKQKALETGIRVGLAYITLGVISAPLEGFIELKIKKRRDGKEYLSAFYAGPIRAAGGTAEAVSLIITDYVRIKTGYSRYDPTEKEIKRTVTEVGDYHARVTNLQYLPSEEETTFLLKNLPIEVNGDPTEKIEVSNYKDLSRIETNRIRGGVCLVLAEGLAQKARKLDKQLKNWGEDFGLEWSFLSDFLELQKKVKAKGEHQKETKGISPDYTYIKDLVAGRPVLSFPMRYGGLRLRYGRTRTTGLAAAAVHPLTMWTLNKYLATGTQLKLERPGKATSVVACDSIDAPIVKLKDGSVINIKESYNEKLKHEHIEKILFLGDILFNYGDFSENGHPLVPVGYCQEWWIKEFEKAILSLFGTFNLDKTSVFLKTQIEHIEELFNKPTTTKISSRLAFRISKQFNIPLHPMHTYFWTNISKEQLLKLSNWINTARLKKENDKLSKLILETSEEEKEILEKIGVPHLLVNKEYIVFEKDHARNIYNIFMNKEQEKIKSIIEQSNNTLTAVSLMAAIKIKDKAGTFIGSRMGRPEKAKMRKLTGSPHFLFPVGDEGGRLRSIQSALEQGQITAEFPVFYCKKCKKETIFSICEDCTQKTQKSFYCKKCGIINKKCSHDYVFDYRKKSIKIKEHIKKALDKAEIHIFPDLIKGVRGTSNKDHVPEHIIKGVLRAKHGIFVNKDGTTRYDMIELPITHFKPQEIGTSIEKLLVLGYTTDIKGKKLTNEDQVVELKPQDLILPASPETGEETSDVSLFKVSNYVDELLERLYKLPAYYDFRSKKDLIGQ